MKFPMSGRVFLQSLTGWRRNNDKKEKRRHYSLEARTYEGAYYAVEDKGISALLKDWVMRRD